MNNPLVSIGVPVYNGEKYLSKTLESLLAQDYPNLEIILSDNGSTDSTANLGKAYAKKDSRILFFESHENIGMFPNFNKTFEWSHGDYFLWAGAHDGWESNFIRVCLEELLHHPNAVLASGEYHEID